MLGNSWVTHPKKPAVEFPVLPPSMDQMQEPRPIWFKLSPIIDLFTPKALMYGMPDKYGKDVDQGGTKRKALSAKILSWLEPMFKKENFEKNYCEAFKQELPDCGKKVSRKGCGYSGSCGLNEECVDISRSPYFKCNSVAGVSCGHHRASSCAVFPQGHGAEWCNGDCSWCALLDECLPKDGSLCSPVLKKLGCYKTGAIPAITSDTSEGGFEKFTAETVIDKCKEKALRLGNNYFAIEYQTKCFMDHDITYSWYGKGTGCKHGRGGGIWIGGPYRMDVYQITGVGVSCGRHRASSCAGCPEDKGAEWCHGDCSWLNSKCSIR